MLVIACLLALAALEDGEPEENTTLTRERANARTRKTTQKGIEGFLRVAACD